MIGTVRPRYDQRFSIRRKQKVLYLKLMNFLDISLPINVIKVIEE